MTMPRDATKLAALPIHHQTAEPFSAVSRARLYEAVAAQIQSLISEGKLKPGDRLPPERELAERFQVSRSSVRDAIRSLEVMGLVKSRQGEGTVVLDITADSLIVPLSSGLLHNAKLVHELLEARIMLEPPIAAWAAVNATDEEIAHLEDVLRRQHERMVRQKTTVEEDSEFHYTIAVAARNAVVRRVVDILMDLLTESRGRSLQVPGRLERSYAGHRRVLRALKRRDAPGAYLAMQKHLKQIEDLVLEPH
jgi:GntR family transcriptional regulator, transcriptional repressor for pyruvate dehydrogenase complex